MNKREAKWARESYHISIHSSSSKPKAKAKASSASHKQAVAMKQEHRIIP